MSSETGVGKTKLLTVYHELVSACNIDKDSRQSALLALLQDFVAQHQEHLQPAQPEAIAQDNLVLAAVMQRQQRPQQADRPAASVMDTLKQLRETGTTVTGLHTLATQVAAVLTSQSTDASKQALNRFLSSVLEFVQGHITSNRLVDQKQLASILESLRTQGPAANGVMEQALALQKAYLMAAPASQAAPQPNQAFIDELLLDHIAQEDSMTACTCC